MRRLTAKEIESLTSRPNVKAIAVTNFLASTPLDLSPTLTRMNVAIDSHLYRWNYATIDAINDGITMMQQLEMF